MTERHEKSEAGVWSRDSRCLSHGRSLVSPLHVQLERETRLGGIWKRLPFVCPDWRGWHRSDQPPEEIGSGAGAQDCGPEKVPQGFVNLRCFESPQAWRSFGAENSLLTPSGHNGRTLCFLFNLSEAGVHFPGPR